MSVAAVESYLYVSECGIVAATALLVFDYCLTFEREVEWLFGTRWTPARIHFTSSRYLPFIALAMSIPISRVEPPSKTSYCGPLGTATSVVYYLSIVLTEAMLVVRTYVFWKCDKRILAGVCTFAVACVVAAIVPSETIVSHPTNSVYKILDCVGVEGTAGTALQFTGLVVYEMGMLVLNWIAFRRMKKHSFPGQLVVALYRDGMIYMAAILLCSVLNAVVTLTTSIQYSDIFNSPQMVLHSILASRIFFNLRETSRQERESQLLTTLTEFHAVPQTPESNVFFNDSMAISSSGGGIHIKVTRESVIHI